MKIRTALIIPETKVPFWIERIARLLSSTPEVELSRVWVSGKLERRKIPWILRPYFAFDERRGELPYDPRRVELPLPSQKIVPLTPDMTQEHLLDTHPCDLLFDCSGLPLEDLSRFSPKLGVWRIIFGNCVHTDCPSIGLHEVAEHEPTSCIRLCAVHHGGVHVEDLGHVEIRTHANSPTINRRRMEAAAIALSEFALRRILAGHPAALAHSGKFPALDFTEGRSCRLSLVRALPFVVKNVLEIFRNQFRTEPALDQWSFAIIDSEPFDLTPTQLAHATWYPSTEAEYLTDPFLVQHEGKRYVFLEHFIYAKSRGHIAVCEVTDTGHIAEPHPVLVRDHHFSFPFIFQYQDRFLMVPEQARTNQIVLYEALDFPNKWLERRVLVDSFPGADNVLLFHQERWWLFSSYSNYGCQDNNLHLFSSPDLFGDFVPHPLNPIVSDIRHSRMAGKIFTSNNRLIRPAQNCEKNYGSSVTFLEIEELSLSSYKERLIKELSMGSDSPFPTGFHTVNTDHGQCVVSGRRYIVGPKQ